MSCQASGPGRPAFRIDGGWTVPFLGAVVLLLAAGCGKEPEQKTEVVRPVKTLTLGKGSGTGTLEYPGAVSSANDARLAFEVPGRITEIPVDEGQGVEKGALLARLDPRDYEAAKAEALAQTNRTRADYERYQDLYAANAVSQQELEFKRRNYEVAVARLQTAKKALEDTYLRAPFAGTVAKRLVEQYENVKAKEPVLILTDETSLEIVVSVPEGDMVLADPKLTKEERSARAGAAVEVSSLPGRRFPARLKEFSAVADPVTRTFSATFAFDAPADAAVLSGMTAKVVLSPRATSSQTLPTRFLVPATAVLADEDGNPYVWKVDESTMTVSRAPVAVGSLTGSEIEIERGLASGDVIAVSGVRALHDGTKIRKIEG